MDLIYRYDPFQPAVLKSPPNAEAAMQELEQGNGRFVEIVKRMQACTAGEPSGEPIVVPVSPISLGVPLVPGGTPVQAPFALVVGCSDARAPVETIFDQSSNNVFVVRVAGNVLGTECLGSVDFAVRNLRHSLRLVVALGHSQCGAVTAAVDAYLAPETFIDIAFTHALRSLVDRIQISVRGASKALHEVHGGGVSSRPGYRRALRDLAVYLNAATTAFDLRRELKSLGDNGVEVVFAVYDLATVTVRAHPGKSARTAGDSTSTFANAPASAEEFWALALKWAKSGEIEEALAATA
jgi:carbonic anhydrase